MTPRRHALAPALAAVFAVAFLTLPSTAGAHAYLVRTDPADGSRFDTPPHQIRLWFSENVSAKLSRVKLTGARTGSVSGLTVTGSGTSLVVSLPKLARDTYSLYWLTTSADDLHLTRGEVAFAFGTAAALPPKAKASPSSGGSGSGPDGGEVVLRWLDFAAIAGLIGALALLGICIPRAARRGATGLDAARRRLAGAATAFAAAALVTGVGLLLLQATGLSTGSPISAIGTILPRTSYGPSWIGRELLIGALLVFAVVLGRRRPSRPLVAVVLLASVALCTALALNSHSAAARGHISIATLALALHLLSAGVWVGGVSALALVLIGKWRADNAPSARLLLRSFGGLAAFSVACVAITGLYSAGVDVASPDALITTFYGRTLLVKTALFLVVGLIGSANAALVRFRPQPGGWLGRGVRIEAGLAAGVILLAALLTASAPARGPRFGPVAVPQAQSTQALQSRQAGDLLVSLTVQPNQPGVNFITAGVSNTRRPAPAPIRAVEFSLSRGGAVSWIKVNRVRDRWRLVRELGRPGTWSIGVRVQRPGLPDQTVKVAWALPRARPAVPAARTVLSRRPLAPLLSTAAAVGALMLLAAVLLLLVRRWKRGWESERPEGGREASQGVRPGLAFDSGPMARELRFVAGRGGRTRERSGA